jgi:hypothetical protein
LAPMYFHHFLSTEIMTGEPIGLSSSCVRSVGKA